MAVFWAVNYFKRYVWRRTFTAVLGVDLAVQMSMSSLQAGYISSALDLLIIRRRSNVASRSSLLTPGCLVKAAVFCDQVRTPVFRTVYCHHTCRGVTSVGRHPLHGDWCIRSEYAGSRERGRTGMCNVHSSLRARYAGGGRGDFATSLALQPTIWSDGFHGERKSQEAR